MSQSVERSTGRLVLHYWLPVAAYVLLIYALSAQPRLRPPFTFENGDKLAHVIEYLGLGLLLARALRASLRIGHALKAALLAIAIAAGVAAGDEVLQSFIPGRDSTAADWLADVTGATLAQLVYLALAKD